MASYNRVTLMGNLTKDPELKYTPTGLAVASFGLAMNRPVQGGEDVTFIDVTVWDKQAESCQRFLKKGRLVLIEGRLRQERWSTPEGDARSKVVVVGERVTFLPNGNGHGNGNVGSAEVEPAAVAGADSGGPDGLPF